MASLEIAPQAVAVGGTRARLRARRKLEIKVRKRKPSVLRAAALADPLLFCTLIDTTATSS